MSGDVQPRKRKEKRRKKDSEEITSNFSVDEHIHVHKDASTGGNICTKILFFLLSFVLLVMVGLVLLEYRGFSDDEALVPVSKWASTFDGWLDETPRKHDDHTKEDSGEHGHAESGDQEDESEAVSKEASEEEERGIEEEETEHAEEEEDEEEEEEEEDIGDKSEEDKLEDEESEEKGGLDEDETEEENDEDETDEENGKDETEEEDGEDEEDRVPYRQVHRYSYKEIGKDIIDDDISDEGGDDNDLEESEEEETGRDEPDDDVEEKEHSYGRESDENEDDLHEIPGIKDSAEDEEGGNIDEALHEIPGVSESAENEDDEGESVEQSGETVTPQRKSDSVHQQSKEVGSGEEVYVKKRESIKQVKEKPQHLEGSDIVPAEKRIEMNNEKQDKLAAHSSQEPVIQDVVTERPTLTKYKDAKKTADVKKESVETSSGQTTKGSSSTIKRQKPRDEVTAAPVVQQSKKQTVDSESPKVENTVSDGRGSSPSKVETSHEIDSKTKDTSKTTDTSKIQGSPKPTRHLASDIKEDRSQSSIKESTVTKHDSKITKEDRKLDQDKKIKKGSQDHASESENIGASAPGGEKKISKKLEEDKTKKHKESKQNSGSHASESETSSSAPPREKKVSKNSKEGRKHETRKELDKNPQNRASGPENSVGTDPAGAKEVNKNLKDVKNREQHKDFKEKSKNYASESGTSGPTAPGGDNIVSKNSKITMQETKKIVTSDSAKKTQYQQKGDSSNQNQAQPTAGKTVDKQTSTSKKEKNHVQDSQASGELGKKVTESSLPKIKVQDPVDSVHHENKPLMMQKEKEMEVVEKPEETKPVNQKRTVTNIGSQSHTELLSSHKDYSKITKTAKKLDEAKPRAPTKKVGDEISNVKTSDNKIVEEEEDEEPEPSGVSKSRQPEKASEDSGSEKEMPVAKSKIPKNMGGQNAQVYSKADITNIDDWKISQELDAADDDAEEKPEIAIHRYDSLLRSNPNSPRAWYGKATALDHLAAKKQSNFILDQAIDAYKKVTSSLKDVPDKLFMNAAERCIDRMRFRGVHGKAVQIHKLLMERFPDKPDYQNQLAVTYLMINRIPEAKKVLENVLHEWPKNGFAQVHYGFILKTGNYNMTEAVRYLQEGISSGEPGTIDGRFFFQLGDALMRLGRRKEALEVNELGVKEGLFLSKYQRSLYNVDRLHAQPWWSQEETTYAPYFRKLEENWIEIKNEGVRALYDTNKNLFKDEAENLRDSGKWKQLELFARGRKITSNCAKAPTTCKLIEEFPAARDCRRGQVKFSVMDPGTHVWPHCGPTNCRLRAHLGLVVPKNTFIRVAEETRSWEEGKLFIFDDSFEHEVWHNGTSTRLVLIVDVWHPDLTAEEKRSLPAI